MQPPDPNTFLKLIWPHLDANTRGLVQSLLTAPGGGAAPTAGAAPPTAAAPAAAAQPAAQAAMPAPAADPAAAAASGQMAMAAPSPRSVPFGGRQVSLGAPPERRK